MVSIKQCKQILNKTRKDKLTNQQVTQIKELLELYAKISVEQFKNKGL
jgi:hypothetical protein